MSSPKHNLDWQFLQALELGEKYWFDIPPSRAERALGAAPSQRSMYLRAQNAVFRLNTENNKFALRLGDFRKAAEKDKAFIMRIAKDGKTIPPPPKAFAKAIIIDKAKKEKIKQLPKDIEQARAAEAAKITENHKPVVLAPNQRVMTKDDTTKLVALVQAHAQGATIQTRTAGAFAPAVWVDSPTPDWTMPVSRLRIKPPKKREMWVLFERGHVGDAHHITAQISERRDLPKGVAPECLIHYREVTPEEEDE